MHFGALVIGAAAGLGFSTINRMLDLALIEEGVAAYNIYHRAFDWLVPALIGSIAGGAISYAQYRTRKAESADHRAEELRRRLAGTERAQAIWVLASSLLHELRNPLHTLGLAVRELSSRLTDPTSRILANEAEAAVLRMNAKFDTLRGMAIAPSSSNARYRGDELLHELRDELSALASRAGVELVVQAEPFELEGDARLVRTALENLISNALDALADRRGGGKVAISARETGHTVQLRVEDNGPGLGSAPELQRQIFEPLSSTKRPHEGLGLGLAIARALIRANNGEVRLVSSEPGRTIFEIELPRAQEAA